MPSPFLYLTLTTLPLATTALYLHHLHSSLTKNVHCHTTPHLQSPSLSLPASIPRDGSTHLIMHERATKVVPTPALPRYPDPRAILTTYLRHNMVAFSRYPPAWMLYFAISDVGVRKTFSAPYLTSLNYEIGDLVNGVYRVITRTDSKVEMLFDPPRSYRGPAVTGLLAVEIREEGEQTVFVNDTVMWREKGGKAVVLEGKVGRWTHEIIAAGLVEGGTKWLMEEGTR
ncbi:hypothetical protein P152DRAFT_159546 [Eremomyces bilateralis CBS 781.70]|uniref:Uncharacterized protein n=1 Tax=Eremomyces bilateralis CBS 781.70 TaxID=1392243 RepID=A0A6G1FV46_9PEZI|nr:uncharacterized protein P152DRAFT_159546 [Eremomyces bilateralis CBS 781.70]KAF1809519.1 hypothetical protein P152DRAFT_159546 [Eremomyces bilateralis CBS 781.70]